MTGASGRRFAVLFVAGTGSTFLTELLRKHPRVHMHGEALAGIATAAEQRDFLRDHYGQSTSYAIGLKAKVPQLRDPDAFLDAVEPFGLRYFRLVRANRVKHAVSLLRSELLSQRALAAVGRPHSNVRRSQLDAHPELDLGATPIDVHALRGTISEIEARERQLDEFLARCDDVVPILYEDLAGDPDEFLRSFCEAIRVEPVGAAETDVVKKTGDDLRTMVTNFEECRAALAGTPYEAMLLDGAS